MSARVYRIFGMWRGGGPPRRWTNDQCCLSRGGGRVVFPNFPYFTTLPSSVPEKPKIKIHPAPMPPPLHSKLRMGGISLSKFLRRFLNVGKIWMRGKTPRLPLTPWIFDNLWHSRSECRANRFIVDIRLSSYSRWERETLSSDYRLS